MSTGNSIFFIPSFFLLMVNIPAGGHNFFSIFKVEAVLPYYKSVFFNILYPASANEFSACGNSIFWSELFCWVLEIISVIKR